MIKIIFIAAGGAIGTLCRYLVSGLDYKFFNGNFPLGTLIVNLGGSLIIGFLWGLFENMAISSTVRMFIFIGILGGFTTFSTFSLECFNFLRDGEYKIVLMNVLITNILGIVLVYCGFSLSKFIMLLVRKGA